MEIFVPRREHGSVKFNKNVKFVAEVLIII
jgi:hypothetical protein